MLSDHFYCIFVRLSRVFEMGPLCSINNHCIGEVVYHVLAADIDDMWKTHDTFVLWIEINVVQLKDHPQFLNECAIIWGTVKCPMPALRHCGQIIVKYSRKSCTFMVIPASSNRGAIVCTINLPSWVPCRWWKAISVAFKRRVPVVSSLAIQCAVTQRYNWWLWSDQMSDVKLIWLAAFYKVQTDLIKLLMSIVNNRMYGKVLFKCFEPNLPCFDDGFMKLCVVGDVLLL